MKNLTPIVIATLMVLNIAGVVWTWLLPRDDSASRTLLSEMERELSRESKEDPPRDVQPKESAEDLPAGFKRAAADFERSVAAQKDAMERTTGPKARHDMALRIQSMITDSYVRRYDDYRTASYFMVLILLSNVVFILCVAMVREYALRQRDAAKTAVDHCQLPTGN